MFELWLNIVGSFKLRLKYIYLPNEVYILMSTYHDDDPDVFKAVPNGSMKLVYFKNQPRQSRRIKIQFNSILLHPWSPEVFTTINTISLNKWRHSATLRQVHNTFSETNDYVNCIVPIQWVYDNPFIMYNIIYILYRYQSYT